MKIAPRPYNEVQRQAVIDSLQLPKDYDKEALDRITHLASVICGVPIALVTLLTNDEQLFLSKQGIESEGTSRDVAFCSHTILSDKNIMIVPDAHQDPRFIDNPLVVKDPSIRFYAGVPIKSPDGMPLGSLCVIDRKPNSLNKDQIEALETLALHVNHVIELQSKNQKLEIANEQLEEAYKSLESFSHSAAHDLREPIKSIEGSMRYLLAHSENSLNADEMELLQLSVDSAERLNDLVEDLLNYSKQNIFTTENFELVDVNEVIERVKGAYAVTIKNMEATVNSETLPVIKAHRIGLQIIFHNLIGNALKYARKDVKPIIDISFSDASSHWVFSVADNGIGFEKEFKKEIFKPFVRLHSSDAYRGSGLGLSLAQKIVVRHKGIIDVVSEKGKGSIFTFTIHK